MRLLGVFFFGALLTIARSTASSSTWSTQESTIHTSTEPSSTITSTGSTSDGTGATTAKTDSTITGPTTTKGTPPSTITGPTEPSTTAGPSQPTEPSPSSGPTLPPGPTDASTTEVRSTITTPIPVTVKKAQMEMTCEKGRCKYLLKVPRLSKAFIDQEQGILATDQSAYNGELTEYKNLQNNTDLKDIQAKFEKIYLDVQNAINSLNTIQAALNRIPTNSLYTDSSVSRIESYVNLLKKDPNICFYDCLRTTPAPTTTTTTTTPTTTPDPCQPDSCNYQATCQNNGGVPKCSTCKGNLDDQLMCATSSCTAPGFSKVQPAPQDAYFVSPNYTIPNGVPNSGYGSNLNCEWQLNSTKKFFSVESNDDPPFKDMDSTAKIVIRSGTFSYTITPTTSAKKVNAAFQMCTSSTVRFTFTTGTVNETGKYFAIQLGNTDGT